MVCWDLFGQANNWGAFNTKNKDCKNLSKTYSIVHSKIDSISFKIYLYIYKHNNHLSVGKMNNDPVLSELCERYPLLYPLRESVGEAAVRIINAYSAGGKLLICGNGGSSSDSDHVVGELISGCSWVEDKAEDKQTANGAEGGSDSGAGKEENTV